MNVVRYHFDTIDSTNTWAKQHIHLFDKKAMSLITADAQTAGRGRMNHHWISPPQGNIYATFCFFVDKKRKDIGNIPQILALSCTHALEQLDFTSSLRWPNDILIENKKVAGILCETIPQGKSFFVAAGIGINVNMPLSDLEKLDCKATSLSALKHRRFNPLVTLNVLEQTFLKDLSLFFVQGFPPFLEKYRKKMYLPKDKLLKFHDNLSLREGFFHQINEDGSLALKLFSGEIKTFVSGEFLQ